jgi:hypothetical protein
MTRKEKINRNIGLTFDFMREVVNDAGLISKLPDNSIIEFVEKDFPTIKESGTKSSKVKRKFIKVKSRLEII